MRAIFKQTVVRDNVKLPDWAALKRLEGWLREWNAVLPPPPAEVPHYVLGIGLEATPRERKLIKSNVMSFHPVLTLVRSSPVMTRFFFLLPARPRPRADREFRHKIPG